MIRSSESALAETQLRAATRVARDAALRSNGRSDSAAVFFFDRAGRITVVPCEKVGELADLDSNNQPVTREVFVPAPGLQPLSLPKGWSVRAYAPGELLSDDWYGRSPARSANSTRPFWLFPETDFYDTEVANDGPTRSTFMIRFQGGTGVMTTAPAEPALVFAPRPSGKNRPTGQPMGDYRADRAEDPVKFVRRILSDPRLTAVQRRQLIGRESGDMVAARPVPAVALYEERDLAAAFGLRVADTGTLYEPPPTSGNAANMSGYQPRYVTASNLTDERIANWIIGDTNLNGQVERLDVNVSSATAPTPDAPVARLYGVDRYTGALKRLETQP
jgi:hypothetical protein